MLDQYLDPDHALALMLALGALITITVCIITGRREDRRREQTSQSTAVEHTRTQAPQAHRATAPTALHQPTLQARRGRAS